MFAAAFLAAAAIHTSGPSAAQQLAAVQRVVPFHVLELPDGAQLMRAEIGRDVIGAPDVRLEYSYAGTVIDVDERMPEQSDAAAGSADPLGQEYNLDGYTAIYRESGPSYRYLSSLVWYRSDLTVALTSRDGVNAPMLLDVALELR
jgi:hypothetical protein